MNTYNSWTLTDKQKYSAKKGDACAENSPRRFPSFEVHRRTGWNVAEVEVALYQRSHEIICHALSLTILQL